ncbi:MAG: hypothetical protein RIR46_547 [Actinomycetota bacterium]
MRVSRLIKRTGARNPSAFRTCQLFLQLFWCLWASFGSAQEAKLSASLRSIVRRLARSPLAQPMRSMLNSASQTDTVFVGLASIPSRQESLRQVVEALLPQVSEMGVYLNNYESVPEFLNHAKIKVARSQKHGDVRDNGKFFFLDKTKATFYATADDDIFYPANYIAELIRVNKLLGGANAVGVHASVYPKPVKRLLSNRHLWHFSDESPAITPADMIGTGTLLFNRRYWQLSYSEIGTPGMADVWFAVAAANRGFGLWSIARGENWMYPLEQEEEGNLFQEGRRDDSIQLAALTEAQIGSTRESLLERIVRSPAAGRDFSLDTAVALGFAAARLGLAPIDAPRLRLFSSALVAHKREAQVPSIFASDVSEVEYIEQLLQRVAGIRDSAHLSFENDYFDALSKADDQILAEYQLHDKRHLAKRFAQ